MPSAFAELDAIDSERAAASPFAELDAIDAQRVKPQGFAELDAIDKDRALPSSDLTPEDKLAVDQFAQDMEQRPLLSAGMGGVAGAVASVGGMAANIGDFIGADWSKRAGANIRREIVAPMREAQATLLENAKNPVVRGVGLAPAMTVQFVAGGPLGFGGLVASDTYDKAIADGRSPDAAKGLAAINGGFAAAIGPLLNKIPGLGEWMKGAGRNILDRALRQGTHGELMMELMSLANGAVDAASRKGSELDAEDLKKSLGQWLSLSNQAQVLGEGLGFGLVGLAQDGRKFELKQGGGTQDPAATAGGVDRPGQERPVDAGDGLPPARAGERREVAPSPPEAANVAPPPEAAPIEQPSGASVPVMITRAMESQLRARGYTQQQIDAMRPQEAHSILSAPRPPPEAAPDNPLQREQTRRSLAFQRTKNAIEAVAPGVEVFEGGPHTGDISVSRDGSKIRVNPDLFDLLSRKFPGREKEAIRRMVDEELIHQRHIEERGGAERAAQSFENEWNAASLAERSAVSDAYGSQIHKMTAAERGAELARMREQARNTGEITESIHPERGAAAKKAVEILNGGANPEAAPRPTLEDLRGMAAGIGARVVEAKAPKGGESVGGPAVEPVETQAAAEVVPAEAPRATSQIADHPVQEVPVRDIRLSKDVPNFKENASPDTGVVEGQQLGGKYERLGTAPIVVWERLNGAKEVITGRHRFDLARRSGERTIPAQIVREAEGFDKLRAFTLDAESNIRDGNGEVKDYAHYFRNRPDITREQAEARGLLSRAKGGSGWALGKDAGDDLYTAFLNGKIDQGKAVAIAQGAPRDAAIQAAAMKGAQGKSAAELKQFARALSLMPRAAKSEQTDLFGFDDSAIRESEALAKAASAKLDELKQDDSILAAAINKGEALKLRPEKAKELGLGRKPSVEALRDARDHLARELIRYDQWSTDPATMNELRVAAGLKPAEPPKPALTLTAEPPPPKVEAKPEKTPEQIAAEQRAGMTGDMFAAPVKPEVAVRDVQQGYVPPRFQLAKPVRGPTGAQIVGYKWNSKLEEYVDARGEERVRKVSDWDASNTSAGTGRDIVHEYFVKHPDGRVTVEGVRSAQNILGVSESRLQTIAKNEQAVQQARMEQAVRESAALDKASSGTVDEAKSDFVSRNWSPMRSTTENQKIVSDVQVYEKNGRYYAKPVSEQISQQMDELGWRKVPAGGTQRAVEVQPLETDPHRIQEIRNSIVEGEMILRSGRNNSGRKLSPAELEGVRRSVESARGKIGEFSLAPPQTIAERQAEMTQAAAKQTIEAKQSERITGTAGDLGTGDMFDRTAGDSALFTHPNALESAAGKAVRELGEVPASESKAAAQSREAREQAGKMGLIGGSPVQMLAEIENFVRGLAREIRSTPKFTAFRETLNAWVGKNQQNVLEIRALAKELERVVPSARRREAITNWLQAGGDVNVLQQRASATRDPRLKRAYVEAMALKPEEIAAADSIRRLYDNMLTTAQQYGLVDVGIENYVNQVWKRPFVGGGSGAEFAGKLKSSFKFGKHRSFESFFDGEQAGFQPVTKDISKLAAMYLNEMNKVIATRDMIRDLTTKTASDGRPLAAPTGSASVTDSTGPGDPQTVFVRPGTKAEDFRDYKTIPNPALAKWKWAAQSDDGTTVLVQGNLALHPEVYGHLKDVLSRSAIREWYDKPSGAMMTALKGIVKAADFGGSVVKQTMLDISPFHYVQEGTHAIGHKVNPFYNLPELNPADPRQVDAMRHGLMLAGDHVGAEQFMDGIAGGPQSLIRRVPWIGDIAHTASDYLFTQYIPRLKLKTYNHILARNEARYAGKLAAGEVTADDVKYLSAQQTNAAYGHLNYADMGRNPTWQHIWRSWLLAPDFLEARARFTGQSLKPGTSGAEQRAAMLTLALVMYGASRVGNILLNEDRNPHFEEPFGIKHNGRLYTMRSVPEDIWRMFKDTRRFVYGRLSPLLGRGTIQALSGVNYRGERVDFSDTASDLATSVIPMSLRALPGAREWSESTRNNPVTAWEQFISSVGLQISRNSPISETHKLAGDWMKQQGMKEDRGNYPVSKYQQLRYALEDNDPVRAKRAMEELTKTEQPWKITQGFRQSLFHPFTQSAGMDFTFRASLDPKDRAVYDHAVETRRAIWKRYTETVAPKP